jgi:hypothetical protein
LAAELYAIWSRCLGKVGLSASAERGVDVTSSKRDIAEYVAKFGRLPRGWDIDNEVSTQPIKRGRVAGRFSPFQILEQYLVTDYPVWAALWLQYARAFFGRQQMVTSPGFWKKYAVVDVVDSDIASDFNDAGYDPLSSLSFSEWKKIRVDVNVRLGFLEWLNHGSRTEFEIAEWLTVAGVRAPLCSPVGAAVRV